MLINEIFSSIQGEGIYAGYRQIFIRFAGCNLSCDYCDEQHQEQRKYEIDALAKEVKQFTKSWHHSISLTGGEPLLQVDRIKQLIPLLPLPIYLETNGTLPQHFKEIADLVDIVSLDYKEGYENEFIDFLHIAKDKDVFVKYVVRKETNVKKLSDITSLISEISRDIPFILQPVTPYGKIKQGPRLEDLLRFYQTAKNHLSDVRVIPQTHKLMRIK
ncbi:MAG: 7-carboxy-7-deazaguanine synthase QueE [Candidatus Margulisiibacteriota bacterium]|nr:MAG: hypothetical protein A2X43_01265 [Candidatus Margulisbacteria bacterium GWD2_39_127]OGI05352.1 MAG: hypothetical protein A2X42_05865 [Candidatus Margulisbacteria bacterium GWF2_38_17]OGI05809.1 MAG: hypothetical protein A2X41_02725 [Candidatus Margulisbacteria bacterium GWE2_39_32]PZM77405.1 MAG: 7-carboxy-7-deazaguanine synthase QueE [Candidatus Margulisiibacteriota bacterium]HAR62287.1 7-carboxy-7-deazaguanine synthase QueE [Candidatus Margulisiibacteriota bacterium]